MKTDFSSYFIVDKNNLIKFEEQNETKKAILNLTNLDDSILIEYKAKKNNNTSNVNVAIAAAISAYSRIHMSQFKNNPDFNLFYYDTDSIYTNKPLPSHLISYTELGLLKLERICKDAVFLSPKVYGLLDENNIEIIKVKGLTKNFLSNINLDTFKTLLTKDTNLNFHQDKWFKDLIDGNITIKDQLYTLKVTENKRRLIYNNDGILIGTTPFIINDNKDILIPLLNR